MTTAATQQTVTNGTKAPATASKMRLDKVVKGKLDQPRRVLVFGQEGVGKSTFAAGAPSPIFLGAEDGTAQLDVVRFPSPENWTEAQEAVRVLSTDAHEYKTLVVDTLDWLEPLIWSHVCARDGEKTIEGYGYGRGYQVALDEWRVFLASLERLRAAKGMHVVLLAHTWIKAFKNPDGPDYDRYELKLNAKAGGLLKEWCDAVLFAQYETHALKDEKTKRVRGVSTGARMLYTQRTAAYDAKNRYGLPDSIDLSWEEFDKAVVAGSPAAVEDLKAEIKRKAADLGGDVEKSALDLLARAGSNAQSLVLINNKLNARIAEKKEKGS